jgi:type VI secretion system protein ImpG
VDNILLRYYERELQHLRETGGDFAREFPKIAGRLGLEGFECADPYVERLLEGFSFLAARVQLKLDAEFPRFTGQLLDQVYPHAAAPVPSMAVVQFQPDLAEGSLAAGFTLPRGTILRSTLGRGDQTACEYRTAQPTTLWPIEIVEARYSAYTGEIAGVDLATLGPVRSFLRIRLRSTAGLKFKELALDRLTLHLRGSDALPRVLYEQLFADALGVAVLPARSPAPWHHIAGREAIRRVGFERDQALLPFGPRSFDGYRLLQEYFAFAPRFLFAEIGSLATAARRCDDKELDLVILFRRERAQLEQALTADNLALHCAPAINLFPKRADRIQITGRLAEYHVVADLTRPTDFEVHSVVAATGYGSGVDAVQRFRPFYGAHDLIGSRDAGGYFQLRRAQRLLSEPERRHGARSSYVGSELFIALVDPNEAPYSGDLRQLGVEALCTNRDLPLAMPLGTGKTDFTVEAAAPVRAVRCIAGPTPPRPAPAESAAAWRLISHLSLNYLSLADTNERQGAEALRELLKLHVPVDDAVALRQIDGVRSVASTPVVRRIPGPGPIAYGRGLEITVNLDEAAFEGAGVFLLGAVLEDFFAKYVTINSFTETVLRSPSRGELARWPARSGRCEIL